MLQATVTAPAVQESSHQIRASRSIDAVTLIAGAALFLASAGLGPKGLTGHDSKKLAGVRTAVELLDKRLACKLDPSVKAACQITQ